MVESASQDESGRKMDGLKNGTMIELVGDQVFHLHNQKISYVLDVMPNGQL